MKIQALAFDTGGTVLDWHSGLVRALAGIGSRHMIERDWHAMANDWRRWTMKHIVGQVHPAFHMDDVHRRVLDETLSEFGVEVLTAVERAACRWPLAVALRRRIRSYCRWSRITALTCA